MNVYLIESSSWVLLEKQIEEIMANNTNRITYNAEETTIEDILSEASYVSMFGEMKYIIVKNANYFSTGKLKEKEEEQLLHYLEQPYPLCTILFTTYEPIDSRKKITKLIKEKYKLIQIASPKGLELYNKVAELLVDLKYLAEKDTINYIIHSCLGNYDIIYKEVEKLNLFYEKPTKLKLDTVKQIISKTMMDNNFKFVDAVISKDLKKSMQYLNDLETLKVEPLNLMNLLAREYRNMLSVKKMEEKKYSSKEIKEELHLQDWQLEKIRKNAQNYHKDDLKDYLISLEKMDCDMKAGNLDKQMALKLFLLNLYEY